MPFQLNDLMPSWGIGRGRGQFQSITSEWHFNKVSNAMGYGSGWGQLGGGARSSPEQPGAAGSRQETRHQEPEAGAARSSEGQPRPARSSQEQPGAVRSSQEQPGAARRNQQQPGAAKSSQEQSGALSHNIQL